MFCKNCGKEIMDEAVVCVHCNTPTGNGRVPNSSIVNTASGRDRKYVVIEVVLKSKLFGKGSANVNELENVINAQAEKGYRLHTLSTSIGGGMGFGGGGGDLIQATMVFERI